MFRNLMAMDTEEIIRAGPMDDGGEAAATRRSSAAQFAVCNFISDSVRRAYDIKISFENADALKEVERFTILSAIDRLWQEHLYEMDSLRYSIGLRGYGQRDPLVEYKAEAFKMFDELMVNVKTQICNNIFRSASSMAAFENFLRNVPQQTMLHQSTSAFGGGTATASSGGAQPKASDVVSEAAAAQEKARAKPVRTGPRSAATTPAPAAAAKNTSSAAANEFARMWHLTSDRRQA